MLKKSHYLVVLVLGSACVVSHAHAISVFGKRISAKSVLKAPHKKLVRLLESADEKQFRLAQQECLEDLVQSGRTARAGLVKEVTIPAFAKAALEYKIAAPHDNKVVAGIVLHGREKELDAHHKTATYYIDLAGKIFSSTEIIDGILKCAVKEGGAEREVRMRHAVQLLKQFVAAPGLRAGLTKLHKNHPYGAFRKEKLAERVCEVSVRTDSAFGTLLLKLHEAGLLNEEQLGQAQASRTNTQETHHALAKTLKAEHAVAEEDDGEDFE